MSTAPLGADWGSTAFVRYHADDGGHPRSHDLREVE